MNLKLLKKLNFLEVCRKFSSNFFHYFSTKKLHIISFQKYFEPFFTLLQIIYKLKYFLNSKSNTNYFKIKEVPKRLLKMK